MMGREPRDDIERLERIVGGAAESVLEATDEEIEAEVRAYGHDPDAVAARMRKVLREAVERSRGKARLARARTEYEERVDTISERAVPLPATPRLRRELLAHVFRAQPQTAGMLTLQFRDLDSLPDEDVTSCLRQLAELGVLDDLAQDDEDGDR